jgi:hypothetical protein
MTPQRVVPARLRPARCVEVTDAHRPIGQSAVEADFGPSHDATTPTVHGPSAPRSLIRPLGGKSAGPDFGPAALRNPCKALVGARQGDVVEQINVRSALGS